MDRDPDDGEEGGVIFLPDLEFEWAVGLDVEIVFAPEET